MTTGTSETDNTPLAFDRAGPEAGRLDRVAPRIRRLVAPNPGPFTFTGTCTYVAGEGEVAVIDPGPDDPGHLDRLLAALGAERIGLIVVTHTHRDHSPGAARLKALTGAPVVGAGPHRAARSTLEGEENLLDAAADRDHAPDRVMTTGDVADLAGLRLEAIETPGHTMNHLCFALDGGEHLFSGDHVMAWSTTIVAPPDGSMSAYMASLDILRGRAEITYWPGHGGPVREPQRFLRGLMQHRRQREAAILRRLAAGDETIAAMVPRIYDGLAPALHGAAALSVFAQLESLVARGLAATDGPPRLDGLYRPG